MKVNVKTKQLKTILVKMNLSQNSFASLLKVSSGYMSQLLDGSRHPSGLIRERILERLNGSQRVKGLKEYTFDDLFTIKGK